MDPQNDCMMVKVMSNVVLIIDMVKGFLESGNLYCGDDSRAIIPNVTKLLDSEIENNSDLIFICDSHELGDLDFQMFPVHCLAGSSETELIPELAKYDGLRIDKKRYSAFYETELANHLERLNPNKVIMIEKWDVGPGGSKHNYKKYKLSVMVPIKRETAVKGAAGLLPQKLSRIE